ncbi:MAG TPA: hypothetical protein VGW38_07510, partial [Chloroflexota bacterium]|nr:hypothetical protein [Chloroflexota bacterium]
MSASTYRHPALELLLGNETEGFVDWTAHAQELTVELGTDTIPATTQIRLKQRPAGLNYLHQARIRLGYRDTAGGAASLMPVFRGFVLSDARKTFPYEAPLRAAGALHRAQFRHRKTLAYGAASPDPALRALQTDGAINKHLLEAAGCEGTLDLADSGTIFGRYRPAELKVGSRPYDLISAIDQVIGHVTFDGRGERILRRELNRTPSATPAWWYEQGINVLSV